MSFLNTKSIRWADTGNVDAFGRARVSQVNTLIDIKQLYDAQPLFIDIVSGGTGTHSHSTTLAKTTISTSAASDYTISQTKQRFNYQSGKSQQIFMTIAKFNAETNITKRVGYFSSSTSAPYNTSFDGFFLENDGTDVYLKVYRAGTAVFSVVQSSWDDPLDGSGDSGITVDWTDAQILMFDFEWLGVGRIRFNLVIDGQVIQFHKTNISNTTGDVWSSSPNQPLRWEIRQSGAGSGEFDYICSTVGTEGSINQVGKVFSSNLGTTHVNANNTTSKYALLGIRLNASNTDALIDLIDYSVLSKTADDQLIEVWLNPTVAGTFTYSSVSNSSVQIAKGAAAGTNTVTSGTLLFSQYISQQTATRVSIENAVRLGSSIAGTLDEIVISTNPLSSNSDVLASLTWRELI